MSTTAQPSTAVATTGATSDRAQLADFSKPATVQKFASLASGGKLDRMTAEQQSAYLVALGQHIGVRAELGEIILYQNRAYLTIDGRLRIAHETGLLDGIDVRPATQDEFARYGCEAGDQLWHALVFKKGSRRPFTGWGHVRAADRNPVSKTHPRELAKKRAKYDALRTAFPALEQIGAMHTQYVEEAEESARSIHNTGVARIASGAYDEGEPDDEIVAGEEVAADVENVPDDEQDETWIHEADEREAGRGR